MKKVICKDWRELCEACRRHNQEHNVIHQFEDNSPLKCYVRFKQMPNWTREFNELERTYEFTSSNKRFIAGMCGNSIFAHCLGYEEHIRLDYYLGEWDIEECWYEEEDNEVCNK